MKSPPSTVELEPDIVNMFPPGSRVLEIACAHGRTAFDLEALGHKVTAVDLDPEAVKEARRQGKEKGSTVEFAEADGRFLPFDSGSFDVVVMNAFLTMLTDMDSRMRAILEAFRVLDDSGGIYVADFLQTPDSPYYRKLYERDRETTGEKGTFIVKEGDRELYRAHHHTLAEIKHLLGSRFQIIVEQETEFTTFHGNRANGIILLALKK